MLPEVGVQFTAGWGKAEDLPTGVATIALDDTGGFRSGEGMGQNSGIAQEEVELGEDEFTQRYVFAGRKGLNELPSGVVLW